MSSKHFTVEVSGWGYDEDDVAELIAKLGVVIDVINEELGCEEGEKRLLLSSSVEMDGTQWRLETAPRLRKEWD